MYVTGKHTGGTHEVIRQAGNRNRKSGTYFKVKQETGAQQETKDADTVSFLHTKPLGYTHTSDLFCWWNIHLQLQLSTLTLFIIQ